MPAGAVDPDNQVLDLVFRALGDPTRRQLLATLASGSARVTELARPFDMSLPAVSKHLRVLENAGLVRRTIEGRVHRCELDTEPLRSADAWLSHYRSFWTDTLDSLEAYVTQDEARRDPTPRRKIVIGSDPHAESLEVRRVIRAPVERVFRAWTTPEELRRWWGPRDVRCIAAEIDLRVDGRYRIGNESPDGSVLWITGKFVVVEPPRLLVYTWKLSEQAHPAELVRVSFEDHELGTSVVVTHSRVPTPELREQHGRGWNGCLDGMAAHLGV